MNSTIIPLTLLLAVSWSAGVQALLIDSFDDDFSLVADTNNGGVNSGSTPDTPNMIGNRSMTVSIAPTAPGTYGAAVMEASGGLLNLSVGPVSPGSVQLAYRFAATDLTEGGASDGIFLSLPGAIDKDLALYVGLGGGVPFTDLNLLFPAGSSGDDFFIHFSDFDDPSLALSADRIFLNFGGPPPWDAQIDFIATGASADVPVPAPVSLFGIAVAGLGWTRRQKA